MAGCRDRISARVPFWKATHLSTEQCTTPPTEPSLAREIAQRQAGRELDMLASYRFLTKVFQPSRKVDMCPKAGQVVVPRGRVLSNLGNSVRSFLATSEDGLPGKAANAASVPIWQAIGDCHVGYVASLSSSVVHASPRLLFRSSSNKSIASEGILGIATTTSILPSAAEPWITMYSVCQTLEKVDDATLQKVVGVSASIKILARSIDCP